MIQPTLSLQLSSLERDLVQLKRTLIENSIVPERSFAVNDYPFDGIVARLTWDCNENVSDGGIVEIKSKSLLNESAFPKNAANLTLGSPIFESTNE
jgi:hypothetical protein